MSSFVKPWGLAKKEVLYSLDDLADDFFSGKISEKEALIARERIRKDI